MSADNCIAILTTSDGTSRVAVIHMIWLNEPDRVERLMTWAEDFNFSPVFTEEDALDNYLDDLEARFDADGTFIEYGTEPYKIEMTWDAFYSQARERNLARNIRARCETCQDYAIGRKFEDTFVCTKCFQYFTKPVAA